MTNFAKTMMYLRELVEFLAQHNTVMSIEEITDHLNRNGFRYSDKTEYGTKIGRKTTWLLMKATFQWLYFDLKLEEDADQFAKAFVKSDGRPAYE